MWLGSDARREPYRLSIFFCERLSECESESVTSLVPIYEQILIGLGQVWHESLKNPIQIDCVGLDLQVTRAMNTLNEPTTKLKKYY